MNGMDEHQWVSLIALSSILIFLMTTQRGRLGSGAWRMAAIWAGIFAIVILFIMLVAPDAQLR